jgi:hypothetical protein
MRDPELMMRAQLAATELERAWDRWRTLHGLGTGPLPPVSSYVGYSTEEPWGQPRVVFGMDAREAEQFAALLDRHDCAGPVYAAMTTKSGTQAVPDAEGQPADLGRGRVRVPAQGQLATAQLATAQLATAQLATAQLATAQRETAGEPSAADPLFGPLEPREPRDPREAAGPGPAEPASREPAPEEEPLAREGQGRDTAESGVSAFRPRHEPGAYPEEEGAEPAPVEDQQAEPVAADRASGGWARRLPGGHALPRQKRAGGSGKGAGAKQEGKDRAGLADLAAELSGWAAGELPGEASHRRPSRPDRPALG